MAKIYAVACRFQRQRGGFYETGVALTDFISPYSIIGLMDIKGQDIRPWNYTLLHHLGCMQLPDNADFDPKQERSHPAKDEA